MRQPLFDREDSVSNEEVIERMKYFQEKACHGMKVAEMDKEAGMEIAKKLREELKEEYQNNQLTRVQNSYKQHELFSTCYDPAIRDAVVTTTGKLSRKNYGSFLYNVDDYIGGYLNEQTYK